MKKTVKFEKKIDFPKMIGEVSAISLEHNLKFVDESNIEGDLLLTGKYKFSGASRVEEDFSYKIPIEIALTEKIDLNTSNIEINDFYYEIENDYTMVCNIELGVEGTEIVDDVEELNEVRECDGESVLEDEIEVPTLNVENEFVDDVKENNDMKSLFSNLDDDTDTYGTFIVYIVRNNETINSIIDKYKVSLEDIEKYNDIKELDVGTKLIIPLKNE